MSNGSYFENQQESGTLDPFAVLGLHPANPALTVEMVVYHYRHLVMRHTFERGGVVRTTGPRVPRWVHANIAREMLVGDQNTSSSAAESLLARMRSRWRRLSVQTWNPFAQPGSADALHPPQHAGLPAEYIQRFGAGAAGTGAGAGTGGAGPSASSSSAGARAGAGAGAGAGTAGSAGAAAGAARGAAGRRGGAAAGGAPRARRSTSGFGSSSDPFVVPDDEEPVPDPDNSYVPEDGDSSSSSSDDVEEVPPPSSPPNVVIDISDDEEEVAAGGSSGTASGRGGRGSAWGARGARGGRGGGGGAARASPSRRRQEPLGIYLGVWRHSGLPAASSNAVYGSCDSRNRVNRRISKENNYGNVIEGGNFRARATACRHEDISYIDRFRYMSKEGIDAIIRGLEEETARETGGFTGGITGETAGSLPFYTLGVINVDWMDLTIDTLDID